MGDEFIGTVEPGRVSARTIGLDDVPEGYRAVTDRESHKVLIRPSGGCYENLDRR